MRHTSVTPKPEMNYKSQIAEVLFNSDTPTDTIMWALSHLPDNNKNGKNKADKYNHDAQKLSEALGITSRKWMQFSKMITDLFAKMTKDDSLKTSIVVQQNLENFEKDYEFRKFIFSTVLVLGYEKMKEDSMKQFMLKEIVKQMKTQKKKKNGNG
jgi:hypothetical protein